jgi:hypothetical protein
MLHHNRVDEAEAGEAMARPVVFRKKYFATQTCLAIEG